MVDFNSMQMAMGLNGDSPSPLGLRTPSPAETSFAAEQQAAMRMQQSQMQIQAAGGVASQFREQLQRVQIQQSFNPYAAQALASYMPGGAATGYGQGYLPSPLAMTPASTGVFRPRMENAGMYALPQMYTQPILPTPFTPQTVSQQFRKPYDFSAVQEDLQANRFFSNAAQVPGIAGEMAGYGAGAFVGAKMMGGGMKSKAIGALLGATGAGFMGIPGGFGSAMDWATSMPVETREMAAGIQNMSQNWVVSGANLHRTGRGLTRDASIDMAQQVRSLASEDSFRSATGDSFNRVDLMQIMNKGGQAGLFDMSQEVPNIRSKLKETATTLKQFMELTNDPDVSNAINQMGKLQQFGMTQTQQVRAMGNLRQYARAAGTTMQGMEAMGGMPGAATFQQANLAAGAGWDYGNFAAQSARQLVATGGVNQMQLALMGGVQGIAQRDMQAQAAFSSMPLWAAAQASYGPAGWGVNKAQVGQAVGGPQGMVTNAMSVMGSAMQQGGIGALAMFGMKQSEIASKAMARMTPEELMMQRFKMAQDTGAFLGQSGINGFGLGASALFGQDIGRQMVQQMQEPGFFRSQVRNLERRKSEIAYEQREKNKEDAPWFGGDLRYYTDQMGGRGVANAITGVANEVSKAVGDVGMDIMTAVKSPFQWLEDQRAFNDEGRIVTRHGGSAGAIASGLRKVSKQNLSKLIMNMSKTGTRKTTAKDVDYDSETLLQAYNEEYEGQPSRVAGGVDTAFSVAQFHPGLMVASLALAAGEMATGLKFSPGDIIAQGVIKATTTKARQEELVSNLQRSAQVTVDRAERAAAIGVTGKRRDAVIAKIAESEGKGAAYAAGAGSGTASMVMGEAGRLYGKAVQEKTSGGKGSSISNQDVTAMLASSLMSRHGLSVSVANARAIELAKDPDVLAEIYAVARDESGKAALMDEGEGTAKRALVNISTARGEAITSEFKANRGALEKALGLESSWLGNYSDEEKEIQRMATEVGGGENFALIAATAASLNPNGPDNKGSNLLKLQKKFGFSDKDLQAAKAKVRSMSELGRKQLGLVGLRSLDDMMTYGTGIGVEGIGDAFRSEGFKQTVASQRAKEYLGGKEEFKIEDFITKFSDTDLLTMSKSTNAKQQAMAALVNRSKGTGEDAKAAKAELGQMAIDANTVNGEGVTVADTTTATGKDAQLADKSIEAMNALEEMAKSMKPAIANFSAAATKWREGLDLAPPSTEE